MKDIVRDIENNKLIICNEILEEKYLAKPDFREKMLENNHIDGLLELKIYTTNNKKTYEYDTSGLCTMELCCSQQQFNMDRVKRVIGGIIETITLSQKYLLEESGFLISPEFVFLERDYNPHIAYCPGYSRNVSEQLGELAEYLMNHIDYHDKDAVVLTYTIYMKTREEGFSLNEIETYLKEAVSGKNGKQFENSIELREISAPYPENLVIDNKERIFDSPKTDSLIIRKNFSLLEENGVNGNLSERKKYDNKGKNRDDGGKEEISLKGCGRKKINTYLRILPFLIPVVLTAVLYKAGILNNKDGKIDIVKLAAVATLGIGISVYIIKKFRDKESMNNAAEKEMICEEKTEMFSMGGKKVDDEATEFLFDVGRLQQDSFSLESEEYPKIVISHFPFYIGKDGNSSDFVLKYSGVSRKHLRLERMGAGIGVIDLGSTNGTFVNGVRIEPDRLTKLQIGDELSIGICVYRLLNSQTKK